MRRVILAAFLLVPAKAFAGKRYESFLLDRVDMTAVLGQPLSAFSSPAAYFERVETDGGFRVDDYRDGSCRGGFDFGRDGRLIHRARALSVLEGRFGRVYARFDYWYPPEPPRVAVNTAAGRRAFPHREPAGSSASTGPIESFALIRVLAAGKNFKIASADYARDGALKALRVDVSSGDWTASEISYSSSAAVAAAWGLPGKVDAKSFVENPFKSVAASDAVEAEAALIYRARGTVVERVKRQGSHLDRDVLAFQTTEAERALARTEAALPLTPGPGR